MKKIEKISKNIKDTERIAKEFLKSLTSNMSKVPFDSATVVGLSGDLGAGKTTFTQVVAKELGIKNKINSPTFVIIKRYAIKYKSFDNFFHIDAYRLKSEKELLHLNWKEIISNPKNLILLEWPENVKNIMPKKYHKIKISHLKEGYRKFEIT